jgi:uncharacterized protein DUF4190
MYPQQPYPRQPYQSSSPYPPQQRAPGYSHPGSHPPYAPQAPSNGLGTAALVLGILAILLAFVPILGFVSYPLAILGTVFGLVGLRRVSRRAATNRGVALAGLITSVFGFVLVIVSTITYVGALNAGVQGVNNSLNAVHNITYKASSSTGGEVIVSYTQGKDGTGSQTQAKSPWSVDTTVTGSVAVLTVSGSIDIAHPRKQQGVTCSIIDRDTGKTLCHQHGAPVRWRDRYVHGRQPRREVGGPSCAAV